jgi:hypothetical protein
MMNTCRKWWILLEQAKGIELHCHSKSLATGWIQESVLCRDQPSQKRLGQGTNWVTVIDSALNDSLI